VALCQNVDKFHCVKASLWLRSYLSTLFEVNVDEKSVYDYVTE
jgi:hypothetical protein